MMWPERDSEGHLKRWRWFAGGITAWLMTLVSPSQAEQPLRRLGPPVEWSVTRFDLSSRYELRRLVQPTERPAKVTASRPRLVARCKTQKATKNQRAEAHGLDRASAMQPTTLRGAKSRVAPAGTNSEVDLGIPSDDDLLIDRPDVPLPSQASSQALNDLHSSSSLGRINPIYNPHAVDDDAQDNRIDAIEEGNDPHLQLYRQNRYPSAKQCGVCHDKIYREWSVSAHAYSAISPMFHQLEQRVNDLTVGTSGYFCVRCHAPVATERAVGRDENLWEALPTAREGVTCIACHRVVERYGRVNGERRIEQGSIHAPVVSSGDGAYLYDVLQNKDVYRVKTSESDHDQGQDIHGRVIQFSHISSSHFCVSCHQVTVYPGVALHAVWDQYRSSPACRSGVRCHDCHMGVVPGRAKGYEVAPSAVVDGTPINPTRRHSNHMFVGPGYSIAHPGLFPLNKTADRWSYRDWLMFDWRAGWGTDEFETRLASGDPQAFPPPWDNVENRYDARAVIQQNQDLLALKKARRFQLMEDSTRVEGPLFRRSPEAGRPLTFLYRVQNLNSGHNLPSGSSCFQRQLWLNVVLTGPQGRWLWESGYVDANGDLSDLHSLEVAAGRIRRDRQLVNFQTKFLINGGKGADREMYLPINVDFDPLPFLRPSGFPVRTMNHPPFIRTESHSIPAFGKRIATYKVPKRVMSQPGRYRLTIRLRSRAAPIYLMRFCQATPQMERSMNEEMLDFHQQAFEFLVR